jgi:putative ABC transport system permease protein
MIRNYFKIAIRNLFRQKLFSMINIFGLALSMSICLLVLLRLKDQLGYDKFHPHPERTYRITTDITTEQGNHFALATTPLPLVTTLSADYNLVEKYTRLYPLTNHKATAGKKELSINAAFTDAGFFNVFGFTLQSGDPATVFTDPTGIVLSKAMAERYFDTADPVGQLVSVAGLGDFRVTGVLNTPAGKSHVDFDAFISMNAVPVLERSGKLTGTLANWNNLTSAYTYVLLKSNTNKQQLANAVTAISKKLISPTALKGKANYSFSLQGLNKIILGEEKFYSLGNTGSMGKVITEVVVAFIILLSACFNYTNLSVARSLNRGKEVGIRKVAGALRYQVFTQFIIESLVIALLSLVVAFVMLRLITDYTPFLSEMVPAGISIDGMLWVWFFLFSVGTGLLAGALPAWILSSFKPAEVLKNLSNIKLFGSAGLRKSLIVAQFALSLIITIFTLIFSKQFNYMATADPGFTREDIVTIPLQGTDYRLLANDIAQLNGVVRVAATSDNLGRGSTGTAILKTQPGAQERSIDYFSVDQNFIYNMGLQLLAGNNFPPDVSGAREQYIIINKKGLELLKVATPAEAIGKAVWLDDSIQVQVAGVMNDFYFRGLEQPHQPVIFRYRPQDFHFLTVKTTGQQSAGILAANMEQVWKKHHPEQAFTWSSLKDDLYERQSAGSTVSMLGFLAFMAVTIACLGLLGMVIYTTETRRREIGIRKVMGAGVVAIIRILSTSFLKLVVIAGVIALPISYLLGFFFLNIFANRITINPGLLIMCFAGIVTIALVTIGAQIFRVATSNPVDSLRSE